MFQIRKMDGSKSTGIIAKIVGVSEHVHNGETTITVHYDPALNRRFSLLIRYSKLLGSTVTASMTELIRKLSLKNFTIG